MDILAHGVYNVALQKTIKKDEHTRREVLVAFLWGIMPDLLAFSIPFSLAVLSGSLDHHVQAGGVDVADVLYPYTHSLVVFGAVFLILCAVLKKWYLPVLGWGFHILLDIPFHTPEFFPTPFLFPISDYTLPFGISWGSPLIWMATWVVVLAWLLVLYGHKKQERNLLE